MLNGERHEVVHIAEPWCATIRWYKGKRMYHWNLDASSFRRAYVGATRG